MTVLSKVFAEGGFGTDAELAKGEAAIAKADAAEWTFADADNVSTGGASTRVSGHSKQRTMRDIFSNARLQGVSGHALFRVYKECLGTKLSY